jgi:hydroxylamine reductase (hybrid-cluster protein)
LLEHRILEHGSRKGVRRVRRKCITYRNLKSAKSVGIEISACHNRRNLKCQNKAEINKIKKRIVIKKRQIMQNGVQRYGKLIFAVSLFTEEGREGLLRP